MIKELDLEKEANDLLRWGGYTGYISLDMKDKVIEKRINEMIKAINILIENKLNKIKK